MSQPKLREGSLVLYKNRPARVRRLGAKLEIELEGGDTLRVRPKDVVCLHTGPLEHVSDLRPLEGEVEITLGDHSDVLEPGDAIYYDSHIAHHVQCRGSEKAVILAVIYSD